MILTLVVVFQGEVTSLEVYDQ